MIFKILSSILAALFALGSVNTILTPDTLDSALSAVFGVPVFSTSVNEKFIEEIDNGDVAPISSEAGYMKNFIFIFSDENAGAFDMRKMFVAEPVTLLGWGMPADLYVALCPYSSLEKTKLYCENLIEKYDCVAFASPVYAFHRAPDYTPNDPFSPIIGVTDWDENNPRGANWWVEAIDARQAWDYSSYFQKIKTGVIDCGYALEHEDLNGRLSFPNERQKKRNIEDRHGTHVAGIIGAEHNNVLGIAGVVPDADMVCVDWQPDKDAKQDWNTSVHIFFGVIDLVRAGAKVINLSLGSAGNIEEGSEGDKFELWADSVIHSALISALLGNGYDFLICQSAGNGNKKSQPIDAKFNGTFTGICEENVFSIRLFVKKQDILDRIIIVSAARNDGYGRYSQAGFSNVGKQVSIAAPGVSVYSSISGTDEYDYLSGTSMAAPVVTGVATLVWSVNPEMTGAQVKKIVTSPKNSDAVATALAEEKRAFKELDYLDYNMVNADLSVQAALLETYNMGRVKGSIENCDELTITQSGKKTAYTVIPGGSFSFVAPVGNATLTACDESGEQIFSTDIKIEKNKTNNIGNIKIPAPPEETETP
ncbi:MAG: S8 family serine peptidase [Clostridia bacterium]|nr:S8 family serine peptidase [Clostridia bacterium]